MVPDKRTFWVAIVLLITVGIVALVTLQPAYPGIWAAVLIVAVGGGAFAFSRLYSGRAIAQTMTDRQELDDAAIYERFYRNSGLSPEVVTELWHEIADVLHLSPGKLRPTDRFGRDIGQFLLTSDELDALSALAVRRAGGKQAAGDLSVIKTVDDYIRRFGLVAK
jgi:hypothetical protein